MRQGADLSVAENRRRSKIVRDLEIGELAMSPIVAHRNLSAGSDKPEAFVPKQDGYWPMVFSDKIELTFV